MPLNGIGSYVPMMDEFSAHWEAVNTELGGTPATDMMLQGAYTRAMFLTHRADLDTAITRLVDLENAREIGVADRDQKKTVVIGRINQFRGMLRGLLPNTIYAPAAPLVPGISTAESKFLAPLDDMASLWGRINADATIPGFTPPLLMGTVTRAAFEAELAAVRAAYAAVNEAEVDLDISRKRRDALLPTARERMVQYRELVPALLGPDHPLSLSLPVITPNPGSTPDPVTLNGVWTDPPGYAALSFSESSDPNLDYYQLWVCSGSVWNAATATLVATLPIGQTSTTTLAGLENPGDTASYKVFTVLTTGNEAGSNVVTITRP